MGNKSPNVPAIEAALSSATENHLLELEEGIEAMRVFGAIASECDVFDQKSIGAAFAYLAARFGDHMRAAMADLAEAQNALDPTAAGKREAFTRKADLRELESLEQRAADLRKKVSA